MGNTKAQKLLADNTEKVLQEWERQVRKEIPAAKAQNKTALWNTLPELIDRIVETLGEEQPKDPSDLEKEFEIAREHGKVRAKVEDYNLDQVIHEYQIFRQKIIDVLEKDHPIEPVDRNVVLDAISFAERKAASEFTERRKRAEEERDRSQQQVREMESERKVREMFVAMLTHDLRTPVAAAKMSLDVLIRQRDNPGAVDKYVGRALVNLKRADRMIQDLLDTNRLKAGEQLPIKVEKIQLKPCIENLIAELKAIHGDRFDLDLDGDISGYWDGAALGRALENLAINAVKYGSKDHPITITAKPDDKDCLVLRVHNFGPPIPQQEQTQLFEPFRRHHHLQEPAKTSWGLGLALVKGVAMAHGGSVEVESSEQEGTTFTLRLPFDARPGTRSPASRPAGETSSLMH